MWSIFVLTDMPVKVSLWPNISCFSKPKQKWHVWVSWLPPGEEMEIKRVNKGDKWANGWGILQTAADVWTNIVIFNEGVNRQIVSNSLEGAHSCKLAEKQILIVVLLSRLCYLQQGLICTNAKIHWHLHDVLPDYNKSLKRHQCVKEEKMFFLPGKHLWTMIKLIFFRLFVSLLGLGEKWKLPFLSSSCSMLSWSLVWKWCPKEAQVSVLTKPKRICLFLLSVISNRSKSAAQKSDDLLGMKNRAVLHHNSLIYESANTQKFNLRSSEWWWNMSSLISADQWRCTILLTLFKMIATLTGLFLAPAAQLPYLTSSLTCYLWSCQRWLGKCYVQGFCICIN